VQWVSRHAEDGIAVKPHGSTRVAGWIVQRDNSRRGLAEEALLESERKYRMLIKGVKDCAILMLGPNGEIRSWKCGGGHACC
jgi:PAS domain-containing protein